MPDWPGFCFMILDWALLLAPLVAAESCHARTCSSRVYLWHGLLVLDHPEVAVYIWTLLVMCNTVRTAYESHIRATKQPTLVPEAADTSPVLDPDPLYTYELWLRAHARTCLRVICEVDMHTATAIGYMIGTHTALIAGSGHMCLYSVPLCFTCVELCIRTVNFCHPSERYADVRC